MVWQLLPDALEICLRIRVLHLFAAGKGHPPHHRLICHILSLDTEVKGGQIGLILTGYGVAPQAVAIVLCLHDITVVLYPAAADLSAMAPAVASHGGEVLQDVISQLIHHILQFGLEFRGVQLLRASRPPGVPELRAAPSEIHADIADAAEFRIFLRTHGVEKARFLG